MAQLTIFYDGTCPLCLHEMRKLEQLDSNGHMAYEDINESDFDSRYPHVDKQAANTILHGQTDTGEMLYGLDVTHAAWTLVGRGWLTAPLRWPLIRFVADKAYLFFARNRYSISRVLTGKSFSGKSACNTCDLPSDKTQSDKK